MSNKLLMWSATILIIEGSSASTSTSSRYNRHWFRDIWVRWLFSLRNGRKRPKLPLSSWLRVFRRCVTWPYTNCPYFTFYGTNICSWSGCKRGDMNRVWRRRIHSYYWTVWWCHRRLLWIMCFCCLLDRWHHIRNYRSLTTWTNSFYLFGEWRIKWNVLGLRRILLWIFQSLWGTAWLWMHM